MMHQLIKDFPEQIKLALDIYNSQSLTPSSKEFNSVLITGLGGSGIGGKIVSQLFSQTANIPILTNNDYTIPAYVDDKTLVVVSSYSGNTEETVAATKAAVAKGAEIACITSGGQLGELASENGLNCYKIPGGHPPRSQFGLSVVLQIALLKHYNVVPASVMDDLAGVPSFLSEQQPAIIQHAGYFAPALGDRLPVLYGEANQEGVLIRWRQQINENSKKLCWHHVFPEMNHNELVGWETGNNDLAVIVLQGPKDHPRTKIRMEICQKLFAGKTNWIENIQAIGENDIERMFYFVHLGDWISLKLAEETGVDPIDIKAIDYLKSELSKIN